jgi:hypothetical protein
VLLGLLLVPVSLVFIFAGVYAAGWLVYGTLRPPYLYEALPLPAALYGVLVWPFIWGFTEQMTYNGYLAPRLQVLCRSTALAVLVGVLLGSAPWLTAQQPSTLSTQDYNDIQQLYARYYTAIDAGKGEAWADTFVADGVFNELKGQGVYDKGTVQLRDISISAGAMNAGASVDIDASGGISGRVAADVKTPNQTLRAVLNISGKVQAHVIRK